MKRGVVDSKLEYPAWGTWPVPGHRVVFLSPLGCVVHRLDASSRQAQLPPPMGWTG